MKTKPSLPQFILTVLLLAMSYEPSALSQVPQGFNYQAIARDAVSGNPITDPVDIKIAILAGDASTIIREEQFLAVDPDEHGLFSLVIGQGAWVSGLADFSDIDWTVTPKYILTKIFFGGGWQNLGPAQLWSVPYAMLSEDTDTKQSLSLSGYDLTISEGNTITLPTGSSLWETDGTNIYRNSNNVGIGTNAPTRKLDVRGVIKGVTLSGDGATSGQFQSWTEGGAPGQRAVYSFYPTFEATPGGYFPRRAADIVGGFNGGNWTTEYLSFNVGSNGSANDVENLTNEKMRITASGNVGIGTISPSKKLHVVGDAIINYNYITAGGIELSNELTGNRFSGIDFHSDDTYTDYAFRLLRYNSGPNANSQIEHRGTGTLIIQTDEAADITFATQMAERMRITSTGNIGIGTVSPTSKVVVQPPDSWDDNAPLFEVKNRHGIPVLAVYNNGVKINIEHDPDGVKGPKGGFAIGGYDYTKAGTSTVSFMNVTPDSIRFNINNDNTKGPKGGFAIGGFDITSKGTINEDFMFITPQNSNNGMYNTFTGYQAGKSNTYGIYNTLFGYEAGKLNENGWANVFIGFQAGTNNLGSENPVTMPFNGNFNVFIGRYSGLHNTRGGGNVFVGDNSGMTNTTGDFNTCVGGRAGALNQLGNDNAFFGQDAGYNNLSSRNTMIGTNSGYNNTSGNYNVFLGYAAGYYETGSNKLFIDNQSRSNESDARTKALIYGIFDASVSNQIVVINGRLDVPNLIRATGVAVPTSGAGLELSYSGGVSYVESYDRSTNASLPLCLAGSVVYPFTQMDLGSSAYRWNTIYCMNAVNVSDSRLKRNISDLEYGIGSIMELEPVTFKWKDQPNEDKHIGLIAQDVAEVIKEVVDIGDDEDKIMGINYSQLVPVLIKGMQEQQQQIEAQKVQIERLSDLLIEMKSEIASLRSQ